MVSNAYEDSFANRARALAASSSSNLLLDPLRQTRKLVTNAGVCKESYFRSMSSNYGVSTYNPAVSTGPTPSGLWNILKTDSAGNIPSYTEKAELLWTQTKPYKGLISTYKFPSVPSADDKVASKVSSANSWQGQIMYGFQFHYNPTSVSMSWGGVPEIDPAVYTSGTERFNALGANLTSSTVTFNLLLNRVHDMKYFTTSGQLKPGISTNIFAGRAPDARELTDIYNKGTMYDVEFFLRTVVGVEIESYLGRGTSWDKKTSDIGWLTGKPVELHLGKSLRYLGRIEGFNLTHVLFTERMVPTFTEMSITFVRIPDYTPGELNRQNPSTSTSAPKAFSNNTTTYVSGTAYNTYTDDLGRSVSNPIFDGTF